MRGPVNSTMKGTGYSPVNMARAVEIKAFVPAKDFELSSCFYRDLGFTVGSQEEGIAYFHHGDTSFLLKSFDVPLDTRHFMMHLLVEDVRSWWAHVVSSDLVRRYGVRAAVPEERPWAMIDFTLTDPSGVLWHIAQNIPAQR